MLFKSRVSELSRQFPSLYFHFLARIRPISGQPTNRCNRHDEPVRRHASRKLRRGVVFMPRARQRFVVMMPIILARSQSSTQPWAALGDNRAPRGGNPDGFLIVGRAGGDPRRGRQDLRAVRRRLLARQGPRRRVPGRFPPRLRRRRLARRLHPAGVRRRGPWRHRSGADDADHRGVGAGTVGRLGPAHEHLRTEPGRGVRQRRAEEENAAAAHCRQGQGLLRGDRAERRARHAEAENKGGAPTASTTCFPARRSGFRPRRSRARCSSSRAPRRSNRSRAAPMA